MKPIIEISGLGKKYPIMHEKVRYGTLRDTIVGFIRHPFRRRKTRESFSALKDINLTVNKGDIIGIIGKNGAGKSTLLKILSGITKPTEGKVKLFGRVSSLLEVGTGFHPELTGRENIFLNGVILGMTRKEVAKKFDEIVAFADIEKFLDTPVKHYSSGMYVRLAFAVAAHLEPDILIVDEVLAVGDAEFQKKCLGKIENVSKTEGRTVLLVSHNLDVIENICSKTIYLDNGIIKEMGDSTDIVAKYINDTMVYTAPQNKTTKDEAYISSVKLLDNSNKISSKLSIDSPFQIQFEFVVKESLSKVIPCIIFYADSKVIYHVSEGDIDGQLRNYTPGTFRSNITIPAFFFNVGTYKINANLQRPTIEFVDTAETFFRIISSKNNLRDKLFGSKIYGPMASLIRMDTKKL
ncbi:MAG: polysaccharide ABC transporter ATP-binding protein [Candidatus Paceibacterota bacterium]|jgi:lipopolysaccharide transport system ATP-binding protein